MHAGFHELTDIAAGRRPAGEHVSRCRDCSAELARMKALRRGLAALPTLPAPPMAWADAQARLARRATGHAAARYGVPLAASILLVLAAAIVYASRPAVTSGPSAPPLPVAPRALVAESTRLEALLAGLPERSTTRLGTAFTIAALEDRLALVDDRLTTVSLEPHAPELAESLWQERVALLESLVEVRYARAMAAY